MYRDREPSLVRLLEILVQLVEGSYEHAGAAGFVHERFVHLGRARAERAVDKTLDAADLHPVVAEAALRAELGKLSPLRQRPAKADATGQLTGAGQLLIEAEQLSPRGRVAAVHVLRTGDSCSPRLVQGGADRLGNLRVGRSG